MYSLNRLIKVILPSIAFSILLLFSGCGDRGKSAPPPTNTPPTFTNQNTTSVNENQTSAITLSATDSEHDTLTYSLNGTDANSFDINSSTGVVIFKNAPDYESKTSYSFIATVSDTGGNTTQNITISINNIAETVPVLATPNAVSIDENISANTIVSTIQLNGATNDQNITTSFTIKSGVMETLV
jgi:hypothetical protein